MSWFPPKAPPWRGAFPAALCLVCVLPGGAGAGWLLQQPTFSAESGEPSEALGTDVALVDLDGDGLHDLVVGAPGSDDVFYGQGALELHANDGATFTATGWTAFGASPYEHLGQRVAPAGDVDGDGIDDLLSGSPLADGVGAAAGVVRWFPGSPGGPTVGGWTLDGDAAGAGLGRSLTSLGDLDADGFGDFAVGAPGDEQVHVIFGGIGGPSDRAVVLDAPSPGSFGWSLAAADYDADGILDLVVGAPLAEAGGMLERGLVFVYPGAGFWGLSGLTFAPTVTLIGPGPGARFGWAVAAPGDVNADGEPDLLVGAPTHSSTFPDAGAALLFLGGAGTVGVFPAWAVHGDEAGAYLGSAVAGGDLDGDGASDVVVGAPLADAVELGGEVDGGRVDVFAGIGGGLPASVAVVARGGGVVDGGFGGSLAGPLDLDGDGQREIVVGHGLAAAGPGGTGAAHVFGGLHPLADVDEDGFCAAALLCHPLLQLGDCDDAEAAVFPGAAEVCNRVDDDCDGVVPIEEVDGDGDGTSPCEGDCDDQDPDIGPEVDERCDAVDHDCDGSPDNGVVPRPYFRDADLDGFGEIAAPAASGCVGAPQGMTGLSGDCDDQDHNVFPGAEELLCNTVDDDCRDDTPDVPDADGDGVVACLDCSFVEAAEGEDPLRCGDCDDADRGIGPHREETCGDGIDQDCDGDDLECDPPEPCDEPDNRCEDDGCSLAGGASPGPGLLLLGLLAVARRRVALALLVLLGTASVAVAAEGDVDTQLLRPSFAPHAFLGSAGADPGPAFGIRGGAVVQYEHQPMVVVRDGRGQEALIQGRFSTTVGMHAVFVDGVGVGVTFPFYGTLSEAETYARPGFAVGDLGLDVTARFVRLRHLTAAVGARVFFPTSTRDSFVGEAMPRFAPSLALQGNLGPVTSFVSAGVIVRRPVETGYDFRLDPELEIDVGAKFALHPERVRLIVELQVRSGFAKFFEGGAETPADLRAAVRIHATDVVSIDLGGGLGLNGGYGAPAFRALVGVTANRLPTPPAFAEPEPEPEEPELVFDEPEERAKPPRGWEPEPAVVENPEVHDAGDHIALPPRVLFAYDSDRLLPQAEPILTAVALLLEQTPRITHVLVEGHASVEGDIAYNWDLSNRRAAAVYRYLVEAGVHAARLSYRGMGEAVGSADDRRGAVLEADRRVEMQIVSRVDEWLDEEPDWSDPPPIPWRMPEAEEEEAK